MPAAPAPLIVACATVLELRAALGSAFDLRGLTPGKPLALGERGRFAVFALVCGVGPVAAAFTLGRVLGVREAALVLNLGICGSYDLDTVPLGATVAVTTERWPDFGLATADGVDAKALGFPQLETAAGPVVDELELAPKAVAARHGLELDSPLAASITVAAASADAAVAERRRVLGAQVENMEGFALALGCASAGVDFLQLRAVSNRVGMRPPDGWDLPGALDALGAAAARVWA